MVIITNITCNDNYETLIDRKSRDVPQRFDQADGSHDGDSFEHGGRIERVDAPWEDGQSLVVVDDFQQSELLRLVIN